MWCQIYYEIIVHSCFYFTIRKERHKIFPEFTKKFYINLIVHRQEKYKCINEEENVTFKLTVYVIL